MSGAVSRLQRLAAGGSEASTEAHLMLFEKFDAAFEAAAILMGGGTLASIIERYREHVAANAARLRTLGPCSELDFSRTP